MLALRSSPPSFGVADAERIARELYGLAVSASPLPGERERNFRLRDGHGRQFVLKIFDLAADAEGVQSLVQALRHVAEQDASLPVPRIVATVQSLDAGRLIRDEADYAACLLSFLPGTLLGGAVPGAALLRNVGDMLARLDRALRGFFHPTLNRRLAWDIRRLPELMEFGACIESKEVRHAVAAAAAGLDAILPRLRGLRSQAIHGDCHGGNLLKSTQDTAICGILDFGDMIHAPLILEPAVTMSELLTEAVAPLDAISAVLTGYSAALPLHADEVELLFDVVTARHATTILVHAWRARNDGAGAEMLAAASVHAARSLDQLLRFDRAALTRAWHVAAGTDPRMAPFFRPETLRPLEAPRGASSRTAAAGESRRHSTDAVLARRRRLLGCGAELFYEKPLHLVRGSGVWLYDPDGLAYLDVYNNVPHVGHTHPAVVDAIHGQTALLATHTRYLHEAVLNYAEELTSHLPAALDACIFVNSGSEANDVAWRMAKMATGHEGAWVMEHAYHGITDAVAALTPAPGKPQDPRVATIRAPPAHWRPGDRITATEMEAVGLDVDRGLARLAERGLAPAAMFVDTAITSSGIFDPPAQWAVAVEARVRAAGALLVADEVQYGLGRSGSHFWGFTRRGLVPDIVTLGKPVANGYPMGVVVARRYLIEAFQARYGFFSTFGGNAVAAAAGLAVLRVLRDEALMDNAAVTGDYLRAGLEALVARHACLGAVRGTGLLFGVQVLGGDAVAAKSNCKRIINHLATQSRILIGYEGPQADILKLRPPMPFRREHADLLLEAIDAAATALEF